MKATDAFVKREEMQLLSCKTGLTLEHGKSVQVAIENS